MPVGYIYNLYGVHSKDVKLVSLFLQQLVIRVSGKRQTVNVNAMQKKYLFLLLLFIGSLGAIPVSGNISMNSTREIEFISVRLSMIRSLPLTGMIRIRMILFYSKLLYILPH